MPTIKKPAAADSGPAAGKHQRRLRDLLNRYDAAFAAGASLDSLLRQLEQVRDYALRHAIGEAQMLSALAAQPALPQDSAAGRQARQMLTDMTHSLGRQLLQPALSAAAKPQPPPAQAMLEQLDDGVLLLEPSGQQVLYANAALMELLGLAEPPAYPLALSALAPDSGLAEALRPLLALPKDKPSQIAATPLRRPDGDAGHADIRARPLRAEGQDCLLLTFHDATDRLTSEQLLTRHLDILAQLAGLSAELASQPAEPLWARMSGLLERVGRFLGADRCLLALLDAEGKQVRIAREWRNEARAAGPPAEAPAIPRSKLCWLEQQLGQQRTLQLNDSADAPEAAAALRQLLGDNGQSALLATLRPRQCWRGVLAVSAPTPHSWLWIEQHMLQSVADMLSNFLERSQYHSDAQRRQSEALAQARIGHWEWRRGDAAPHWSEELYQLWRLDPARPPPPLARLPALLPPADWPPLRRCLRQVLRRRETAQLDHRILLPDGGDRHVRHHISLEQDGRGRVVRLSGTLQDISEFKRREQTLQQAAAVYEHTLEGVMIADADLRILDVNPAFSTLTGYARADLLGQSPRLLHSGRHDAGFYRRLWQTVAEHGRWQGEIWNRHKDGSVAPAWLTVTAVRDADGAVRNYVGVFSDIAQIKKSAAEMAQLAHYDSLTTLPNRLLFLSRLEHAIQTAKRERRRVAVLFIDLDNFKQINDTRGHGAGDRLLVEVAARLKDCLRANDTVARIGGDEFLILLENQKADNPVIDIANKIVKACARPFRLEEQEVEVGCSVGISIYPRDGQDAETLMRNADAAMYQAKNDGKGAFRFYTEELTQRARLRVEQERELRLALERRELFLVFQPKYHLQSGALIGAEALLRWQHPSRGLIGPDTFIPLAEETGLIIPIGSWLIRHACGILRRWKDAGLSPGVLSLNIAGAQIQRAPILQTLKQALRDCRVPPQQIELEITERFVMSNPDAHLSVLRELRQLGVGLSIDDFGTGYSSLSYLRQLPVQTLKIDQSLVRGLPDREHETSISLAIISLAKTLHLGLVAEGVENEAQRRFLLDAGCEHGQGFLYARPMPENEFAELVKKGGAAPLRL
ncbi:EAL domain-containing protein [Chromobacterium sp. S0633]|uniref:sensor domain-containing protein n=1 Tax=Chromobacterium sp. S0633 TaxID=2957805 RepID=UPI0020A154D2|nr:EAL domain-containing protein [Chromobacterium sp. S0633]MCP1289969.1 EAL domain-containing protein [Chromobacterium sp. S0633]